MSLSFIYWVTVFKGGQFYTVFPTTQISNLPDPALRRPVSREEEPDWLYSDLKGAGLAFFVLPPQSSHLVHLFMATQSDQDDLDISIQCYRNVEGEEPVLDDWRRVQFHWQRSRSSLPIYQIDLYKVALMGIQPTENQTFTAIFSLDGLVDHTAAPTASMRTESPRRVIGHGILTTNLIAKTTRSLKGGQRPATPDRDGGRCPPYFSRDGRRGRR